jgi:HSP20 family molecular chaperone IbpA
MSQQAQLQAQLQQLFGELAPHLSQIAPRFNQMIRDFGIGGAATGTTQPNVVTPQITVSENDTSYSLKFRIPQGIEKSQLALSLNGDDVTLSDKGYADANTEDGKTLYDERPRLVSRTVTLSKRIKDSGHTAVFNDRNELVVMVLKSSSDASPIAID